MRLVILTSFRETKMYLKNNRINSDIVFPTNAYLYDTLKVNNIQFISLSDFINEPLYNDRMIQTNGLVKKVISELNSYSNNVSTIKDLKIDLGDYFSFNLQVVLGQLNYMSFLIEQLNLVYKPDKWLLFYPIEFFNNLYLGFRPSPVSVFQKVFVSFGFCNVKAIRYFVRPSKPDLKVFIKDIVPDIVFKYYMKLRMIKLHGIVDVRKKPNILALDALYDWSVLLNSKQFKGLFNLEYRFFHYEISVWSKDNQSILEILNRGITLNDQSTILSRQANIIGASFERFKRELEIQSIKLSGYICLLNTVFVKPEHNYLAHLANQMGIPVLTWQHGEMGAYTDIFQESIEVRYTNIYFCYGDGVARKYLNLEGNSAIREVISVGNLTKKCSSSGKEYILYATGKWTGVVSPFFENINTDSKLYSAQSTILNYLDNVSVRAIFKASNHVGQNSVSVDNNSVEMDFHTPFIDLVSEASIIILDTPSTTLIESVSTDKPIFVLSELLPGKWNNDEFIKLLEKRVMIYENVVDLIDGVDKYLEDGLYNADVGNNEFYRAFASKFDNDEIINIMVSKINSLTKNDYE